MKTQISIKKEGISSIIRAIGVADELVEAHSLDQVNIKITPMLDWDRSTQFGLEEVVRVFQYDLEVSGVQSLEADV